VSERVVVIGGGVIGLCIAHEASRRGLAVTVVERKPARRDGCSFGNAGMIVPSHVVPLAAPGVVGQGLRWMWNPESPFRIRPRFSPELFAWGLKFWRSANRKHVERSGPLLRDLHLASRRTYEELVEQVGDFGLVTRGLLMLCTTNQAFDEEAHAAGEAQRLGLQADVLDPAAAAALDPGVTMSIVGAIHHRDDRHFDPSRFMALLQRRAEEAGVEFRFEHELTGWLRTGRRIEGITTNRGEIRGDRFVVAGGSWSPVIARQLGLKVPLQAGKGYSLTVARPRQLPRLCSILTEARVAVTPLGEALRFGGTMEIAGRDESISPRRVRGIVKSIPKYFPEFRTDDFDGIEPWVGLRPVSPDGLPYLGAAPNWQNLIVATGHAMMGMSLAPITGRLVGQMLTGERPEIDLSLLRPERFG